MVNLSDFWATIRQLMFGREIRIDFVSAERLENFVLARENYLSQRVKELASSPAPKPDAIVGLCNDLFRLRRNAEQQAAEGINSKEVRSSARALEHANNMLKDMGIEYIDLTGEVYDDGRTDFDPIAEPEIAPGLDRMKILRCERPVILLNGKLIQKGRGLVVKPA